tara:strand:- start:110 stop:1111 length:1002 start_codon:yes stop_codon:yes gene_type:complete
MTYEDSGNNLIPLTELADSLGIKPKKKPFDVDRYLPVELIPVRSLYVDKKYQRLLNKAMIKNAGEFDPILCRPIAVFKRPDGKYAVADGQHTSVIGYLYTDNGAELLIPCQVQSHKLEDSYGVCASKEAQFFEDINKNRTNVTQIERLRCGIAYEDNNSLEIEQNLISMGVSVEGIGADSGLPVKGYSKILEAHKVGLKYAKKAIYKYNELNEDPTLPSWKNGVELSGALIGGLSRVYNLIESLGNGEKSYVVKKYMDERVKKFKPEQLTKDTAGSKQSHLIALKIVNRINSLIDEDFLTKQDGTVLKHTISPGDLKNAGIVDPTAEPLKSDD